MLLGALIDAGVPLEPSVRGALGSLAIDADTVWTERVTRAGLAATKFCVRGEDGAPAPRTSTALTTTHGSSASRPLAWRCRARSRAAASHRGGDREPHRRLGAQPGGQGPGDEPVQPARRGRSSGARHIGRPACTCTRSAPSIRSSTSWARCTPSNSWASTASWPRRAERRRRHDPLGARDLPRAGARDPAPAARHPGLCRPAAAWSWSRRPGRCWSRTTPRPSDRCRRCASNRVGYGAGARDFADTPNVTRVMIGEADGRPARRPASWSSRPRSTT